MAILYKICPSGLWREAEGKGIFTGAPVDAKDGFIHFSSAGQIGDTAAKHFAGQDDLLLVAVDGDRLGAGLRWEPARGGDLFPHLYGPLDLSLVLWVKRLPLGTDGRHLLPKIAP